MWCLFVAENMTKCPLMKGVRLQEVPVRRGSTEASIFFKIFRF